MRNSASSTPTAYRQRVATRTSRVRAKNPHTRPGGGSGGTSISAGRSGRFQRWLCVEDTIYDHAYLSVSTNNSTWTDVWENEHGLDPLANDADADPDADNWSNLDEYIADSDPNDSNWFPMPALRSAMGATVYDGLIYLPSPSGAALQFYSN